MKQDKGIRRWWYRLLSIALMVLLVAISGADSCREFVRNLPSILRYL